MATDRIDRAGDLGMKTAVLVASALATALSAAASQVARAEDNEKCYGIALAGKNDCMTATTSCAGMSKTDGQGDAWIYVPAGTCEKIIGGSLTPKT
jgi:uncharacterized membrane protein